MKIDTQQMDETTAQLEAMSRWHELTLELLSSMGDMHGTFRQCKNIHSILDITLQHVKRVCHFQSLCFLTVNESDSSFALSVWEPEECREILQQQVDELIESGQFAWAINQNRPVTVESERFKRPVILHVLTTKSRVRGMFIGATRDEHGAIPAASLNLLSVIMHNCAQALESAALYQLIQDQNRNLEATVERRTRELEHRIGHDELTGLPNRILYVDRIKQSITHAKRHQNKLAVLLLDIDLFNRINETMGHGAGDNLLKAIAKRMTNVLRSSDSITRIGLEVGDITISRLGGDEFSLLVTDLQDYEHVTKIIFRINEALASPFSVSGHEVFITTSIGISLYPADGETADTLLKNADIAMHHAKEEGRNNYQFYAADINSISYNHLVLESQLRHALTNNEFVLYYQPKIDIKSGLITGAEALVRWQRDDGTLVPPNDFIPLAEQSGLILPLGEWVLQQACRQTKQWHNAGLAELKIAVNLSAQQFRDKSLIDKIRATLEQTQLPASALELELTESTVMKNVDSNICRLQKIHELGIRLSIDDFGTGYSSLSYLKRFPIDTLKIDRSFVKDISSDRDDEAIVTAIIAMAHSLNLSVVAEGVEHQEHLEFLSKLACEQAQGFYFSKPVPANEFIAQVKSQLQG